MASEMDDQPFLIARYCGDPNPHIPHAHPKWADEAPRYWCRGVENVREVLDSTGCE